MRRVIRFLTTTDAILAGGWLILLALLEIAGRRFTSDFTDGMALAGIGVLGMATASIRRTDPPRAGAATLQAAPSLWERLKGWSVDWGVDFCGTPPVPRGVPRVWLLCLTALMALVLLAATAAPRFPSAARDALVAHCYLVYLFLLGLCWGLLCLGILGEATLGWIGLHDWCAVRYQQQQRRSKDTRVRAALILLALSLSGAAFLPVGIPLAINLLFLSVAGIALFASSSGPQMIWRYRRGGAVSAFDGRWLMWLQCAIPILLTVSLALISNGAQLAETPLSGQAGSAPVTSLLGRIFAWLSIAGNYVVTGVAVRFALQGIAFNPQRLHSRSAAESAGRTLAPEQVRRGEIQSRRQLVRQLQRLFRRAARHKGSRGTGLWIGLQHWFVAGLTRDDDPSGDAETTLLDKTVGPPFHRVFSGETRYHFWRVTRALQIDLIFVENGVSFRRLVRVLRMMFEVFDIFGGRQRAEERHFTGLPGVRVVIHEFDMCTAPTHGRERYPEPDYEQVGRARILHVFKDRGEAFEKEPIPTDWEGIPVLSGAGS